MKTGNLLLDIIIVLIGIIIGMFVTAYIQIRLEGNKTFFKLGYRKDLRGNTFFQRLISLFKNDFIINLDSMATCNQFGKVIFHLPAIYNDAKKQNFTEEEMVESIIYIDEHEHMHRVLFWAGLMNPEHHHIIINKMMHLH